MKLKTLFEIEESMEMSKRMERMLRPPVKNKAYRDAAKFCKRIIKLTKENPQVSIKDLEHLRDMCVKNIRVINKTIQDEEDKQPKGPEDCPFGTCTKIFKTSRRASRQACATCTLRSKLPLTQQHIHAHFGSSRIHA